MRTRRICAAICLASLAYSLPVFSQSPTIKWEGVDKYIQATVDLMLKHHDVFSGLIGGEHGISKLEITFRYDDGGGSQLGIFMTAKSLGAIRDMMGEKIWNPDASIGSVVDALVRLGQITYLQSDRRVAEFLVDCLQHMYIGISPAYDTTYVVGVSAGVFNYPMIDFVGNIDLAHETITKTTKRKAKPTRDSSYGSISATYQYGVGFTLPDQVDFAGKQNNTLMQFIRLVNQNR